VSKEFSWCYFSGRYSKGLQKKGIAGKRSCFSQNARHKDPIKKKRDHCLFQQ
jgi:hypothetical protein